MSLERKKVMKKQRRNKEMDWRKSNSCSQDRSLNLVGLQSTSAPNPNHGVPYDSTSPPTLLLASLTPSKKLTV
jgi:hypothetical protein